MMALQKSLLLGLLMVSGGAASRASSSGKRFMQAPDAAAEVHAANAEAAASTAKQAAHVANQVAAHSVRITEDAQAALRHAHRALEDARVDAKGLSKDQKE